MNEHVDSTPALVVRVIGLHPASEESPPVVLFEETLSEEARLRAVNAAATARREHPNFDMVLLVVEPATLAAACVDARAAGEIDGSVRPETPAIATIFDDEMQAAAPLVVEGVDQVPSAEPLLRSNDDVTDVVETQFIRCRDCSTILTTANSGTVDAEGACEPPGAKICHTCAGVRYASAMRRRADHISECDACNAARECAVAEQLAELCGFFATACNESEAA